MKEYKRIIIIAITFIFILLISIFIIGKEKIMKKDSEGRIVVESSEDLKDLEKGTLITVAITEENKKENKEKEKKEAEEKRIPSPLIDVNDLAIENEKIIEDAENIKNEFKQVITKYYGDDYANDLFERIEKEIKNNTGRYKTPESSLEMLDKALDLYNSLEVQEKDKETIRNFVNETDVTFIEDNTIVNKIKECGIMNK